MSFQDMDVKGSHNAEGCRFAIIVSRFNEEITSGLLKGARGALAEASVRDEDVTVIHVPGAFEIPVTARRVADQGTVDAVIGLGCLIKGDTMHFEYIAAAASQGMMDVSTSTGIPVAFGVLTAMTDRQAEERSADGPGNKGREAALAAVEMATLFRLLGGPEGPPLRTQSREGPGRTESREGGPEGPGRTESREGGPEGPGRTESRRGGPSGPPARGRA